AASMQRGGARWLPSGVAALIPAGKVVPIRLRHRDGSVGSAELLDLRGLAREVAAGLKPGSEHPRSHRLRLPAGAGGESPQHVHWRRTGKHAESKRVGHRAAWLAVWRAHHLDAPLLRVVDAEPEVADLGVVDEDADAPARQEPRHRKVRRVVPGAEPR